MNESNALLVQQFHGKDPSAFNKLVGRHHSLVFRVCLRILGHRQDAEDATQETFSRAARYLHSWDSRRPLEPWLVAIAGNRCRSLLARRPSYQSLHESTAPVTSNEFRQGEADCLREEFDLALSQVPESQERAFRLFHEQGLSYVQIAERLECPVGTAKTWVHRARSKVIRQLRDREVLANLDANVLPDQKGRCE